MDLLTMLSFIVTATWGRGFGGRFEQTENELFGIPEMADIEIQGRWTGWPECGNTVDS